MRSVFLSVVGFLILTMVSCGDIIEPNIENKSIQLLAPADQAVLTSDTVVFWWEYLENARSYHVRIASPNLTTPLVFIADSVTNANILTLVLPHGSYEWEVRGINSAYSTGFFFRSFSVDTTGYTGSGSDISNVTMQVIAPAMDAQLFGTSVTFWWEEVTEAKNYQLRVVSPSFSAPSFVLDTLISSSLVRRALPEGDYEWSVRALNPNSETSWTFGSFQLEAVQYTDLSAVSVVKNAPYDSLKLPEGDITFWWEVVEGAESYQVQIVSPNFEKVVSLELDETLEETSLEHSLDSGTYQWRVRAFNPKYTTSWSVSTLFVD